MRTIWTPVTCTLQQSCMNPELYFEMQSQLEGAHSDVPSGGDTNHLLGAHVPTDVYTKFGNPATSQDSRLQYYEPGQNNSPVPY